jgi:hypothetical protein
MTGNDYGLILQERDRHLLAELARLRVLTLEQIMLAASFNSRTRAKARTLKLIRQGLLMRWFIGGPGAGRRGLYALTRKGAKTVGVSIVPLSRKAGKTVAVDLFSEHQLRINDVYLALRYGALPRPDVRLQRWLRFQQPISSAVPLIPDAYFELEISQVTRACFLEVDLGGEALKIWQKKVRAYLQLALSGEFAKRFGQERFSVLVLAPSLRRLQTIRQTVLAQTDKIFWFAEFEQVKQAGLWAAIWLRPRGDSRLALL